LAENEEREVRAAVDLKVAKEIDAGDGSGSFVWRG
jgi:hypothetical protein